MTDQHDEAAAALQCHYPAHISDELRNVIALSLRKTAADARAEQKERDARVCEEVTIAVPGGSESAAKRCVGWDCAAAIRAQVDP